ncbi:Trp biosynthesis-associated membrane protein [Arthrobacter sp. A5]|uniref:Trp biosynthesis-associated membrane protein n=1 Tax=Arthrobacter sp. A5 TaxID=576926 RepID=UPI003DA83C96
MSETAGNNPVHFGPESGMRPNRRPPNRKRPGNQGSGRFRRKSTLIMLAVVGALVVFGSTTQTWVQVKLGEGVVQQADLNVPGSKAATAVTALALVALAGALAASIAGRISRVVAAIIIFLGAAGIVVSALAVVLNPQAAAAGPVGTATGVTGQNSDVTTTVFPLIAVAAAVVLGFAAVLIAWLGRSWNQRTKYDAAAGRAAAGTGTGAAAANAAGGTARGLETSHGTAGGSLETDGRTAAGPEHAEPLDDIDSWDQLSRGDDPTS